MWSHGSEQVEEGLAELREFTDPASFYQALDKPNARFKEGSESDRQWQELGVAPQPFPSVAFWAPPRRSSAS